MKYCSPKCRTKASRTKSADNEPRQCAHCAGPITDVRRLRYCGTSCGREAARIRERGPKLDRTKPIPCARCGTAIAPRADGPLPTYCSGACRAAVGYEKAKEDGRYEEWRQAQRARSSTPTIHTLTCQYEPCGKAFEAARTRKYCEVLCERRAYTARRKADGRLAEQRKRLTEYNREYNRQWFAKHGSPRKLYPDTMRAADQRRRARKRGVEAESIRAADVYARDAWTCWLCALPIDPGKAWPSPDSASLDHVIPLSKGGPHTMANVKASHLSCNLIKSDRDPEGALKIFAQPLDTAA
ncbi:HNH endonuclease [Streptomyces sp. NPDC057217]|uniref:HNH endonuclease n=1 Tax=Streptomyces sp. NPDC057217 TaxID=3346054 RepID=UPI0036395D9C